MTTNRPHTTDCPHRAAINDEPWQSFPSYAKARAYLDRKLRKGDVSWIRCSIHEPTPNERAAEV